MARGGRDKDRDDPERRCIATGESQPKAGLIRFVISPEGVVAPDVAGRLPGRGIYVSASRAALEKAAAKGLFSRAAKAPVTVPPGLVETVESVLARRLVDTISMARKAGQAVCGFEKVKDWLEKGEAAVLVQASDGSERGKGKLYPPDGPETLIGCLTAGELGLSFARERAIHAALAAGGLAERAVEEAARLAGLRGIAPTGRDGGRSAGKEQKA
jgi:predicted RNA-binding protein YlxR (DUF448 family)